MTEYEIVLKFKEYNENNLLEYTSILYDLELLYDYYALIYLTEKDYVINTRFFWSRGGRPIPRKDKLHLKSIHKESPLEVVAVAAAGIVVVKFFKDLVALMGTIEDYNLERDKKELDNRIKKCELKRLELQNELLEYDKKEKELEYEHMKERILKRLKKSPLKIQDVDINC
jgi:hypothetical protein